MHFETAQPITATPYLEGPVMSSAGPIEQGMRVLDVGCGNGYWAGRFGAIGCDTVGIDPSPTGISVARKTYPDSRFEQAEITKDILTRLEEQPFDLVVSTEVVEHLYSPQSWAAGCFGALRPGGTLVLSTPYHGWLKNIVIAVANKTDFHHDSLREGGHIKFFSRPALERLLDEAGFVDMRFIGAGRAPLMWKSTVMSARRPTDENTSSAASRL
jgi:2-polyprenyl-3-methyl-5-hydroxy-6-metoxy-1,4-benzoquinol methylase